MQSVTIRPRATGRPVRPSPLHVAELLDRLHEPTAAARLASLLFAVAAVVMAATVWILPAPADRTSVALTAFTAALTAAALPLIPWARLPPWTVVGPPLLGLVEMGVGLGALGGALHLYVLFFALVFLHVGLTRPPGTSLRVAPAAVAAYLVALAGLETTANAPGVAVGITVSVLVGELLAIVTGRQRAAQRGLERVLDVTRELNEEEQLEGAAKRLSVLAQELLRADGGAVLLSERSAPNRLRTFGLVGPSDRPEIAGIVIDPADPAGSVTAHVMRTGEPVVLSDVTTSVWRDAPLVRKLGIGAGVWLPLPGVDGVVGVLAVWWESTAPGRDSLVDRTVEVLVSSAGPILERLRTLEELTRDAASDPLTGLRNRRGFLPSLDLLPPGSSIVLLDLDHFKRLNDSRGHDAGDVVLVAFAQALLASVRDGDGVCRWGGEEFALVMPGAGTPAADAALKRLREGWEAAGAEVTFSAGVAETRRGEPVTTTLARSDAALYRAKKTGRDRWVVDEGLSDPLAPERGAVAGSVPAAPAAPVGGTGRADSDG